MDLKPIYLLYGEETYLIKEEFNRISKQFGDKINGINYIQLDDTNVYDIIPNIETPAFGYPKKLVVVRESQLFKKQIHTSKNSNTAKKVNDNSVADKLAQYIAENMETIKEQVILIFIESEVDKNNLYKAIEKNGMVMEFMKLKIPEAMKKIKIICNAYNVHIDENTLKYFVEACGTDMQTLINEIRKQIEYVGKDGTITRENIDKLAIKQLDSIIFDLTDNLGNKNIKTALEILDNMIYEKEPIQKILITLYNHFKKLYFTKIATLSNQNIAETLKLKPNQIFLVSKYKRQSSLFNENDLKNILQDMINLDYNTKIGKIDEYIGLESILCKYCS